MRKARTKEEEPVPNGQFVYGNKHQPLCGKMASELRQAANRLDAGEVDCFMYFEIDKNMAAKYSLVDGRFFMSFESYVRNFISRYGREAVERALFPPPEPLPAAQKDKVKSSRSKRSARA